MNKKTMIFILTVITFISYNIYSWTQQEAINASEIMMQNIEALANGEGGSSYACYGHGDIYCDGIYVAVKATARNLQ